MRLLQAGAVWGAGGGCLGALYGGFAHRLLGEAAAGGLLQWRGEGGGAAWGRCTGICTEIAR